VSVQGLLQHWQRFNAVFARVDRYAERRQLL
jgi:hypothetical protein